MAYQKSVLTDALGINPNAKLFGDKLFDENKLYHYFEIKPRKKLRKSRHILSPRDDLKAIQRAINKSILIHVPPHSAATAFFPGCSIAFNAGQHKGCSYLYKTDVSDFFTSINADIIHDTLKKRLPHFSQFAIDEIVRLTTYKGVLPQGAPTSPHLANLALYSFDENLSKFCDRLGARYTRYADDISVSAEDMESLLIVDVLVRSGLSELGLSQHPSKTRFMGPKVRKVVTGLDVSGDTIRPPKAFRRKTAALVRMCERYPRRATRSNYSRILGYLLHWQGVSPEDPDVEVLRGRLKKIKPDELSLAAGSGGELLTISNAKT